MNYKNLKGFTLIELLAVIVILAVIALILTPIVSGIIKTAKKNAFESTGYGILESTKLYYSKKVGDLETDLTFTCNNDTCTSGEEKLEFKGNINGSGTVLLFKDGNIALCLENSNYATIKNISDERLSTTENGSCEFDEETKEYTVNASIPASQYQALQAQYDNLYSSLGTTDISNIGDGTVTGAISEINNNLTGLEFVKLAETTSSAWAVEITLSDSLSNYKAILLANVHGTSITATTLISMDDFRATKDTSYVYASSRYAVKDPANPNIFTMMGAQAQYQSDTTVYLRNEVYGYASQFTNASYYTGLAAALYGIK